MITPRTPKTSVRPEAMRKRIMALARPLTNCMNSMERSTSFPIHWCWRPARGSAAGHPNDNRFYLDLAAFLAFAISLQVGMTFLAGVITMSFSTGKG